MRKKIVCFVITLAFMTSGCTGYMKSNTPTQLFYGLFFSTTPALNPLVIKATDSSSITLAQPTLLTSGNPTPTVVAYIGINGVISVNGPTVSNFILPPGAVDVSAGDYTFNGLSGYTTYRIIVVTQNTSGYSVSQIVQSTGGIAPVMDPLSLTATADTSITLSVPTFSTAGNPLPPVQTRLAYIGYATGGSAITVDYLTGTVTNNIGAAVDVNSVAFPYPFSGLTPNTAYMIIVVAQNSSGLSIRQIAQNTGYSGPVLDPLVISATNDTSITLASPGFTGGAGNPAPTTTAYIGLVTNLTPPPFPLTVNYATGALSGTVLSSTTTFPAAFSGLTPNTSYRIIVVSQNSSGVSVRAITQSTAYAAPVLDPLLPSSLTITSTSITLAPPGFSGGAGNPAPTTTAYIGLVTNLTPPPFPLTVNYATGALSGTVLSSTTTFPAAFSGLTTGTAYRIIVISVNSSGMSIREITATTP